MKYGDDILASIHGDILEETLPGSDKLNKNEVYHEIGSTRRNTDLKGHQKLRKLSGTQSGGFGAIPRTHSRSQKSANEISLKVNSQVSGN